MHRQALVNYPVPSAQGVTPKNYLAREQGILLAKAGHLF